MGHEEDIINNDREQRQDLLLLAQQKLDEINRSNLGLSGGGGRNHKRSSAVSSTLLSTLLYIAIMAHKLEDMKTMLEEEDVDMHTLLYTLLVGRDPKDRLQGERARKI